MVVPVYVINLNRRPDRLRFVTEQLDRLGLKAWRIPALDAETAEFEGEHRVDLGGSMLPVRMDRGAAACLLSHFAAMQTLTASGAEAGLILEDDAELSSELPLFIESTDWWPEDAEVVSLEALFENRQVLGRASAVTHCGRELRHIKRWSAGAAAYLIRGCTAAELLRECHWIAMPIDHLLFNPRISRVARRLRPLQVLPTLARQRQDDFPSDLAHQRQAMKRPNWLQRRRRKLMPIPYEAAVLVQRLIGRAERIPVTFADRVQQP